MKKHLTIILVIILALSFGAILVPSQPASAALDDIYVSTTGDDLTGNGTVGNPYKTIGKAIDVAVSGDTVYVASGTYVENITWDGKNIAIIGHGAADTTIDGNGGRVIYTSNLNSAARLEGFTITKGSAGSSSSGGGMYNDYYSSPTVTNCTFTGNSAGQSGGGMYNILSSPTVTNCTFTGNSAGYGGGGMYNYYYPPTVTNCTFSGNSAFYGGGIHNNSSLPKVINCTFVNNSGRVGGGMANFYSQSKPKVTNCTFYGNKSTPGGGAMYNFSGAVPVVTNCILYGDKLPEIYGDPANITYSDVQGGYPGTGNINAPPLFDDASNGDFHLKPGSPCIDKGSNAAPSLPLYDFEGDPRIFPIGGTVDMGVDEVANQPPDTSQAYASPDCLWPANHKMVNISIMGVTDPDGDPVTITITGITSDEPTATDKGSGGAKHAPDADGIGTDTASLRAERSGGRDGDGRVYVISFTASDGIGGECEGSVEVKVPHDQSDKECPAIDSGQKYDATQLN